MKTVQDPEEKKEFIIVFKRGREYELSPELHKSGGGTVKAEGSAGGKGSGKRDTPLSERA